MAIDNLFPQIGEVVETADNIQTTESGQEEKVVQEIESLCMQCEEQGVTRLMLTSIPFFREVIVMSFRCESCGSSNNTIQSAGTIRPEGATYTVLIETRKDLNRQLVRSESCEVIIPELDLTLPPTSHAQLTTVEGLIRNIVSDLSLDQPLRRIQDETRFKVIQAILDRLKLILGDDESEENSDIGPVLSPTDKDSPMTPFTIRLDDPAGNSFVEFYESMADPRWNFKTYQRTLQQNIALGLASPDDDATNTVPQDAGNDNHASVPISDDEVLTFPGICSSCAHPIETRMKKVNIPHFKDIVIMSTNCQFCGYRDNEVKSGAAISDQGKRITIRCVDREDLSRDVLKSDTAGMTIPEIDLVLTHGTLGGRFTTVEGLLEQIYEELGEKAFMAGDSANTDKRSKLEEFLASLKQIKSAEQPFTIILDDPLANSYIQNLYAPDPDPNMKIEWYDRTFDQNEELGLNDIKVEGYELP